MKLKTMLSAASVAAMMLCASCTQGVEEDANYSTQQTILAEFVEPEDALQTRSCVDVRNTTSSSTSYLWEPGDQIGVYSADDSQRNVLFTNKSTKKVATAEFDGTFNGTPYYAYYPYSANNNGVSLEAVKGTILAEQPYNHNTGSFSCFYRYGKRDAGSTGKFAFKSLLTMLKLTVNAAGTALEGERLNSIVIKVVGKDGTAREIAGDFTFDVRDGSYEVISSTTTDQVTMPWTSHPILGKNSTFTGYVHIIPDVDAGDKMVFEVITEGHKATFTAELKSGFAEGKVYNLPLTLKTYKASASKYAYSEVTLSRPTINAFSFKVSDNSGKLINNELKWNSSSHTPSFSTVSELKPTAIDNDKNEINMTIPYLYDFKLIPTFSVASGVKVTANGVEVVSGETEIDFTHPVTFTLTATDGGVRAYTVNVTNTGLPVVVINQSTSGSFSKEYEGGFELFGQQIGGTLVNQFVDFMIRGKKADWVTDDVITVYNADGTVDCSAVGGVRLRGNTSKVYPKKPFAIKFDKGQTVLGMPKHKRWVLLANWLDHSMIRNTVAFDIAQVMEYAWRQSGGAIGQGIPWNVHGQNVELVFIENGEAHHVGNYLLCEQIKIDGDRLDIMEPYDIKAPGANDYTQYGHLLEIDPEPDEPSKFSTSNGVNFMFKDEVTTGIRDAVKAKVQRIENNLDLNTDAGYEAAFKELDINSVIDQMLIWELGLNREYGDPKSIYMFMNGDGKLSAGPVWDFDRGTFQNQEKAKELCDSKGPAGSGGIYYRIKPDNEWMYWRNGSNEENKGYSYVWYRQLAKSATYKKTVQERWAVIKPYLEQIIPMQIQHYGQALAKSYAYDSAMWPTAKADIRKYKSDFNDWSGDEQISDWNEVINNFVTVFQERLAGMDALITSGKFTE